jgi:DNA repair exonuclease SbcCD nuclease subunit
MDEKVVFWQFGCWNNLNNIDGVDVGGTKKVLDFITSSSYDPDFIIVSGDNYYPHKTKKEKDKTKDKTKDTKSKEKEEKTKKEKNTSTKTKTIFPSKLDEGLLLLPERIPIYMILGNHDLETNKERNLYVEDPNKREENEKCEIIDLELKSLKARTNVKYYFFKAKHIYPNTLILMIDTSIYEIDETKYLDCYNKFFASNPLYKDKDLTFSTIEKLKAYQLRLINIACLAYKGITNLIIVGHHPIYQLKNKTTKDPPSSTAEYKSDIHLSFTPVLRKIFTNLPPSTNYYYLCSDLHLYQKGLIEISFKNPIETMTIHQYIVGSGGTELDPTVMPITTKEYSSSDEDKTIKYKFLEEIHEHGFLECTIKKNENPIFEFIPIPSIQLPLAPYTQLPLAMSRALSTPRSRSKSIGGKSKRKTKKKSKKNYKKNYKKNT